MDGWSLPEADLLDRPPGAARGVMCVLLIWMLRAYVPEHALVPAATRALPPAQDTSLPPPTAGLRGFLLPWVRS